MKIRSDTYIAYFDGACEPVNPGGTASYGALMLRNDQVIWQASELYEPQNGVVTSNNMAEYAGLIAVLNWLANRELFHSEITVHGDSKLVINQVFGTWRIKNGLYAPLAHEARALAARFSNLKGKWISREWNTIADELSKAALHRAGVKLRLQWG